MDNKTLEEITQNCCPNLYLRNLGVSSANNFLSIADFQKCFRTSQHLKVNFFYQIVNSSKVNQVGQHWLLVSVLSVTTAKNKHGKKLFFKSKRNALEKHLQTWKKQSAVIVVWDCLGEELNNYFWFYKRLKSLSKKVKHVLQINYPIQNPSSNMCGLNCLLMAHLLKTLIGDEEEYFHQNLSLCK